MTPKFSVPVLEIRSQPQGRIEGYASVFNGIDSYGDSIAPGAYARSLGSHKAQGTWPVMLWSHQHDAPVGRWLNLEEDTRGLRVSGQLNLDTDAGKSAFAHLKAGDINGLSIGYQIPEGGTESVGGVRRLNQIELFEISIVSLPADSAARVQSVKNAVVKPQSKRDLEHALHGMGYSRREAAHIVAKGYVGVDQVDLDASRELVELAFALESVISIFKS